MQVHVIRIVNQTTLCYGSCRFCSPLYSRVINSWQRTNDGKLRWTLHSVYRRFVVELVSSNLSQCWHPQGPSFLPFSLGIVMELAVGDLMATTIDPYTYIYLHIRPEVVFYANKYLPHQNWKMSSLTPEINLKDYIHMSGLSFRKERTAN